MCLAFYTSISFTLSHPYSHSRFVCLLFFIPLLLTCSLFFPSSRVRRLWLCAVHAFSPGCESGSHEKRLLHALLDNYNVLERPVVNESDPLQLSFGLTLMQIIDVVSIKTFNYFHAQHSSLYYYFKYSTSTQTQPNTHTLIIKYHKYPIKYRIIRSLIELNRIQDECKATNCVLA